MLRVSVFASAALLLAAAVTLTPATAFADFDDLEDAIVYTAQFEGGAELSDEYLISLTEYYGTVELLRYYEGEVLERIVVRLGEPQIGCPGFTSTNRDGAEEALRQGAAVSRQKDGSSVVRVQAPGGAAKWTLPATPGVDDFRAEITVDGQVLYRERREERVVSNKRGDTDIRPTFVRLDSEDGDTIIQLYDWEAEAPVNWQDPYAGFSDVEPSDYVTERPHLPENRYPASGGLHFDAMHGFIFEWDSGFWPGGGTSPGSFPVQVRLMFGAAWARGADIDGSVIVDGIQSTAKLGPVQGNWWVDYGVELDLKAALTIPFLPSLVIDLDDLIANNLDYIPSFDLRYQRQVDFDHWLINQGAVMREESDRYRVFTFDAVDAILGVAGVSLPSWIPLSAGVKLDASVYGQGTLNADPIIFSDFTTFDNEQVAQPITLTSSEYHVQAQYTADLALEIGFNAYPAIFAEILFMKFDLPVGELTLPIPLGSLDMDFDLAPLNVTNIDLGTTPEGEAPEGEVDPIEGEAEEGEVDPGEGEAEEGEVDPAEGEEEEGEVVVEPAIIACETYNTATPVEQRIVDFVQTESIITVDDSGTVDEIVVWLDLFHHRMGDTIVSLQSPSGTRVYLFSQIGGDSAHMLDTTLSDKAAQPISTGVGPYQGAWKPAAPLSQFAGEEAKGNWILTVQDLKIHNAGVLYDWAITINPCGGEEGESVAPVRTHTSDYAPTDGVISLNELLRLIQIFNSGEFSCAPGSEDGYTLGAGYHSCPGHDSDYAPTDWNISLNELLRAIQFFNSGGYFSADATEDGFAPGKK